jgi:tetratricopeptide (TPR) repeat protein
MRLLLLLVLCISTASAECRGAASNKIEHLKQAGSAHFESKRYSDALQCFQLILNRKPSPEAYFNVGLIFEREQKRREALEHFTKSTELDDKFSAAWLHRAWIHEDLEEFELAIQAYKRAVELDPTTEDLMNLAVLIARRTVGREKVLCAVRFDFSIDFCRKRCCI